MSTFYTVLAVLNILSMAVHAWFGNVSWTLWCLAWALFCAAAADYHRGLDSEG